MTTHLRARVVQAGALLALVGGILVVAPTVAMADEPSVTIDSVSTDIPSGGTTNLKYTITNKNLTGGQSVQVTVTGLNCSGDCGAVVTINPQQSVTRSAQLTAPQVAAGQTQTVTLQITATVDNDKTTASQQINVHGADKPKSVRQISGRVKESNGKAIAGATVIARDSTGATFEAKTNGDGGYAITSTDAKPIVTGSIVVGAAKEGYAPKTVTVQGRADQSIDVPLTLTAIAASPSPTPSASASASAEPSEEATDETDATDAPSTAAAAPTNTAGEDSGSGSLLFIILGGLLVAAGVGAIVLVLMRRRDKGGLDGNPDGPGDPDGPGGPGGAVPASQGRFNTPDATRVGAPVGAGASDATMITSLAPQSSLADAPTMLQQAVPAEDEFPDPYGAPAVMPGNYAGPGGWGTTAGAAAAGAGTYGGGQPGGSYGGNQYGVPPAPTQAGGYDDGGGYGADQYGRPQNEDAYGAYGAGQYDGAAEEQRFDEPTGMYRPDPQGGYGQDQGGYESAGYQQNGYDQGGYAQGGQSGYDAQQGYGQQGYDQGGYGGGPESGSYGQASGEYHQEPEYPPAGQGGGYQSGGYQGAGYGGPAEPAGGDQGGYGSWNAPGGGIDSGNAYGPPAAGAGAGGGGYDQRGGYGAPAGGGYGDQGGYDQRGGYGQPDGGYEQGGGRRQQGGGGYGSEQGYAGGDQEAGGRHGGQSRQQPPESTQPGQRRSLDWLDD